MPRYRPRQYLAAQSMGWFLLIEIGNRNSFYWHSIYPSTLHHFKLTHGNTSHIATDVWSSSSTSLHSTAWICRLAFMRNLILVFLPHFTWFVGRVFLCVFVQYVPHSVVRSGCDSFAALFFLAGQENDDNFYVFSSLIWMLE